MVELLTLAMKIRSMRLVQARLVPYDPLNHIITAGNNFLPRNDDVLSCVD